MLGKRAGAAALLASIVAGTVYSGPAEKQTTLTVGIVQIAPTQVPSENLARMRELIGAAARQGASAVALPEHSLMGPIPETPDPESPANFWEVAAAQSERALAGLARQYAIWIASPAAERAADRKSVTVNTRVFDHTGQMAARQAKIQPRKAWGDGDAAAGEARMLGTLDFPGARIGAISGDDIDKGVPRLAALGAEIVLVSASWEATDIVDWRARVRDLAARHRVNVAVSNLASPDLPKELWSFIAGADGAILAEAASAENQTVVANVPVREKERGRYILGLPDVPIPSTAANSARDIEFGRKLFFDGKLAADGKTGCAACHDPAKAFADGKRVAVGAYDRAGHRNTPTLLNSAFKTFFGWDGSVETMERQALHALLGWAEMNRTAEDAADYVNRAPEYAGYREAAGGRISADAMFEALSAYMRTLTSGDSPFDRYYYGRQASAIGEDGRRGLALFRGKAKCAQCHRIGASHALFSDNGFHNTGVGFHKRFEYLGYSGDGIEGNMATRNRFRGEYFTPTLRNIALTAPYMHDGSIATIEDAIEFYDKGGNPNPFLDSRLAPLNLTPEEKKDLTAFLKTLNGAHERNLRTENRRTDR